MTAPNAKRVLVLHPFWLAAYPVLALLTHNLGWTTPSEALRALLFSLAGAAFLTGVYWLLARDIYRAGLLASLTVLIFFSYGHIYGLLKAGGLGASIGRHRYLAPAMALIFVLVAVGILRRVRDARPATTALNVMSGVLVALPLISLVANALQPPQPARVSTPATELRLPEGQPPPDVYYIILDAYARQDTLQRVYGFDNTPFLDFLRERGFFVAEAATSNYAQTGLSLASSLNMNYLDALLPELGAESRGRQSLWDIILHSEVRRQLEGLGYETVAFSTGLPGTEWRDADVYLSPGTVDETLSLQGANPFESMLAQTTLVRLVSDGVVALPRFIPTLDYPYEVHRTRIAYILDNLGRLSVPDRPRFIFAHIVSPHPPFVFGAEGQPLTPDAPFTLRFTFDASDPSHEEYLEGYSDQVAFVNRELERIIASILSQSSTPPVIILQGDHGPDSNTGRVSYVQERMTIFNAYLLPSGDAGLYAGISPVNSFRVVFNQVFGGTYPRLPDRVLYSEYDKPYSFFDVTNDIHSP
ncbi:MAG TPA: sulfatase-like hydrolase/transferase [Anaerolineales bacterium]|nr:sulfatase-like hydrolase/transferase [Anaerolineales bacterium]